MVMSSSGNSQKHQLPVPTRALPELTKAERKNVLRLARMVKSDQLWRYTVRRHDERDTIELAWSNDGGACLPS